MEWYHWLLGLAALLTAIVAARYKLRRALLWIGALTVDFIISVGYLYMPKPYVPGGWWPPPAGINVLLDASVAIAIYALGRRAWETVGLYSLVLLSCAVNLLYATGQIVGFPPIPSQEVYGIVLEAVNYAALLLIGGTALLSHAGARHGTGRSVFSGIVGAFLVAREALLARHQPFAALRKKR